VVLAVMDMGSPQQREKEDEGGDGEADAQAVAEGAAGVVDVAAKPRGEAQ